MTEQKKHKEWTLLQKLKKFSGVRLSVLKIFANAWDGFGFTFLSMGYDYVRTVTMAEGGSVLHISWKKTYEANGEQWDLKMTVLFYSFTAYTWVIIPRQKQCPTCDEYYKSSSFEPYCCEWCQRIDE